MSYDMKKHIKLHEIELNHQPLSYTICFCSGSFYQGLIDSESSVEDTLNKKQYVLSIDWKDQLVRRKMNFSLQIHASCYDQRHIVLPFPVKQINHSQTPSFNIHTLSSTIAPPALIKLCFQGWFMYSNWDECNQRSSDVWPDHLSSESLAKMMPMLLHEYPLQHQATILVKVLDGFMLFVVHFTDESANSVSDRIFAYHPQIPIELVRNQLDLQTSNAVTSSNQTQNNKSNKKDGLEVDYDFHRAVQDRISFNISDRLEPATPQFIVDSSLFRHHSMVITSPSGSGKTHFLRQIEKNIRNNHQQQLRSLTLDQTQQQPISCYYCDASAIKKNIDDILEINSAMSSSSSTNKHDEEKDEKFEQSLSFILAQLFPESSLVFSSSLVLLIDNLDVFYQPFLNDDDKSSSSSSSGSSSYLPFYLDQYYRIIAFHLHVITHHLRKQSTLSQHFMRRIRSIYLIGTSSLQPKQIPLSVTGSFDMELLLSLSKPSFRDRCHLIHQLLVPLTANHYELENLAVSSLLSWMIDEIREIFINHSSQREILDNDCIWSYRVAGLTQGYLPGDLCSLFRKMMNIVQAKQRKIQNSLLLDIPNECDNKVMVIAWEDMSEAISTSSLRAMSELEVIHTYDQITSSTALTWQSFIGYEKTIEYLQFTLSPLLKPSRNNLKASSDRPSSSSSAPNSLLEKYRYPKGMILHGPSGCGKTFLSKIISKQLNANLMNIQCTDILSKYFGETESKIRHIFQVAHQIAPTVLFFDEFDAIAHRRMMGDDNSSGGSSHGNIYNRILSTFLNELDGITISSSSSSSSSSVSFVLVIVACKSLDILDEALIRPGRLQYHVELSYPSRDDVQKILHAALSPYHFTVEDHHLEAINQIPQLSISLLQEIIEKMKLIAVKERIQMLSEHHSDVNDSKEDSNVGEMGRIEERHWKEVIQKYLPEKPLSFFTTATWNFDSEVKFNSGI